MQFYHADNRVFFRARLRTLRHIIFLDVEDIVSAWWRWFISPPFRLTQTNSTYQKVVQMHVKHIPIWVHSHCAPITSTIVSYCYFGLRHNNGNTAARNEGNFGFQNVSHHTYLTLSTCVSFFLHAKRTRQ